MILRRHPSGRSSCFFKGMCLRLPQIPCQLLENHKLVVLEMGSPNDTSIDKQFPTKGSVSTEKSSFDKSFYFGQKSAECSDTLKLSAHALLRFVRMSP